MYIPISFIRPFHIAISIISEDINFDVVEYMYECLCIVMKFLCKNDFFSTEKERKFKNCFNQGKCFSIDRPGGITLG